MTVTKEEAERRVDNSLERIRILATVAGAPDRVVETIERERELVRTTIRAIQADGAS